MTTAQQISLRDLIEDYGAFDVNEISETDETVLVVSETNHNLRFYIAPNGYVESAPDPYCF